MDCKLQYLIQIHQLLVVDSKMKIKNIIVVLISIILVVCSFINIYVMLVYDDGTGKEDKIQMKLQKQQNKGIIEVIISDQISVIDNITKQSQQAQTKKQQLHEQQEIISPNEGKLNQTEQSFYSKNLQPIYQLDMQNLTQQQYQQNIKDRISMGTPSKQVRRLKIWVIKGSTRSYHCALINSINILTPTSISTIKKLISDLQIGNIVIFVDRLDHFADQLIQSNFNKNQISFYNFAIDSDYKFVDYVFKSRYCHKIIYLSHNFDLLENNTNQTKILMDQTSQITVYYSQSALINNEIKSLQNLEQVDLSAIEPAQFNKHIYIFDQMLLSLVTPVNFGYYAKYTIQEIIIYPILALSQKYGNLKPFKQVIHQFNDSDVQYKHFSLVPPQYQSESLCFISYPSNPSNQSIQQLFSYLENFKSVDQKISLILFIPYKFTSLKNNGSLFVKKLKFYQQYKKLRIRLIIKGQRAISSLSIYQGAYNFCPKGSLIISTRHNIKFKPQFFHIVSESISQKYHYYWVNSMKNGKQIIFPEQLLQNNVFSKDLYENFFSSIQIFKGDLLKSGLVWNLITKQLNFYQTQFSFVKCMVQMTNFNISVINKTLVTIYERNFTQNEKNQNKVIDQLPKQEIMLEKQLSLVLFNQLENEGFKRQTPQIIPHIIHRVSLSSNQQQKQWEQNLNKKLQNIDQDYKIMNWNEEEITQKQFPLVYPFFVRYSQLDVKNSEKNRQILMMLIKYEALYNYGGVYLDSSFNVQNLQSLKSFFKFQIFFMAQSPHNLRGRSSSLNFRIMGATQHNYYLKLTISELISQQRIDKMIKSIDQRKPEEIIQHSLNDQELLMRAGFGLNYLNPRIEKTVIQKQLQKEKNEV